MNSREKRKKKKKSRNRNAEGKSHHLDSQQPPHLISQHPPPASSKSSSYHISENLTAHQAHKASSKPKSNSDKQTSQDIPEAMHVRGSVCLLYHLPACHNKPNNNKGTRRTRLPVPFYSLFIVSRLEMTLEA
ncbi:hypothetical protein DL98DRAFT_192150 [Cadophora sp. DSE1049]|nr:hypothetical protein DL98DRAFT_192150 [Cadophora sp. DSE1049]